METISFKQAWCSKSQAPVDLFQFQPFTPVSAELFYLSNKLYFVPRFPYSPLGLPGFQVHFIVKKLDVSQLRFSGVSGASVAQNKTKLVS